MAGPDGRRFFRAQVSLCRASARWGQAGAIEDGHAATRAKPAPIGHLPPFRYSDILFRCSSRRQHPCACLLVP